MKKKRLAAWGLIACMLLPIAACGSAENTAAEGGETQAEAQADSAQNTATGTAEASDASFFPLNEKITVTIAAARDDSEYPVGDRVFFQELEKETNLAIDWIDWPNSQKGEKLNLTFAGGTLPDALMGNFILSTSEMVKYGTEGWLMTWNDYINEEYMPNFYALCERAPGLLESITAPDGNIYGLPQFDLSVNESTPDTIVINTEWLEKVGMEMPTTTEEFYEVLKAFKEAGDLNGNGKADEIPFTFLYNEGNSGQLSFMGFTGLAYNTKHERVCYKNGEVVYVPKEEEYKEFLTYMNRLYSEGLIDPECFTMTSSAYNAKVQTAEPTCGVISIWDAQRVNAPLEGNDPNELGVYQYMPPLQGESGVKPVWVPRILPYNRSICFVISSDTEYAEELVRWADLQFDLETSINNVKGKEGVHIEKISDGVYKELFKEDGSSYSETEKTEYIASNDGIYGILKGDFVLEEEISPQSKQAAGEIYDEYLNPNHVYTYSLLSEEESKLNELLQPPLNDHVDQWTAEFITNGGIEERWDEYLNGLYSLEVEQFEDLWEGVAARAVVE